MGFSIYTSTHKNPRYSHIMYNRYTHQQNEVNRPGPQRPGVPSLRSCGNCRNTQLHNLLMFCRNSLIHVTEGSISIRSASVPVRNALLWDFYMCPCGCQFTLLTVLHRPPEQLMAIPHTRTSTHHFEADVGIPRTEYICCPACAGI